VIRRSSHELVCPSLGLETLAVPSMNGCRRLYGGVTVGSNHRTSISRGSVSGDFSPQLSVSTRARLGYSSQAKQSRIVSRSGTRDGVSCPLSCLGSRASEPRSIGGRHNTATGAGAL
jgi:hypothetical protein